MEWRLERGKKENLFKCVCVCVCTADICTHVPKEKGGGGGKHRRLFDPPRETTSRPSRWVNSKKPPKKIEAFILMFYRVSIRQSYANFKK